MDKNPRAIAGCVLAASLTMSLAACATPGPDAPVTRRTDDPAVLPAPDASPLPAPPEGAGLPPAPALPEVVIVPGPPADDFVGAPLADLEAVIGTPALVRAEGTMEFRRYDLGPDCRAFVLALPDGGTVLSIDTGAAAQGDPAPAFEDCTAREAFAGS